MLIAGAVCPHPPLLIPAALGGAAEKPPPVLRTVAAAAGAAVAGLLAAGPDLIVVVGGGQVEHEYGPEAAGGLREYGVRVTVGTGPEVLPLSLTVGRWLLERAGVAALTAPPGLPARGRADSGRAGGASSGPGGLKAAPPEGVSTEAGAAHPGVLFQEVHSRAPAPACVKLGAVLAERAPRVALLAMGDASARRARQDPDVPDPLAAEYDEEVAEALAAADTRWLARLDPARDTELAVAGRAAWQVLAGAAEGGRLAGRLLCMAAPYGVTYLVALWQRPRP
jgi:hypothetical protein